MFDNGIYGIFAELQKNPQAMTSLMESANAKYNNTAWKQFCTVQPLSRGKRFGTIIEESNIDVKASLLSAYGKKPLRSFEGYEKYFDSMHKIGHGFKLDQADINSLVELNLVDQELGKRLMDTYMNRMGSIVQGFHSVWNSWVYSALSNYKIVLKNQDVVEGEVDMRVPANNKLVAKSTPAVGWFDETYAGSKAEDLLRMNKRASDTDVYMPSARAYFLSKDLADKMIIDEDLRKIIVATMGYVQFDSVYIPRDRFLGLLSQTLGIPPFVVIDEKSRIEINGTSKDDTDSFDKNKIILAPLGQIFNMHPSQPDYAMDSNPNTTKGFTEGGIIGSLTEYHSDPFGMITNMEAWAFPTFKNPKKIVGLDISKGSTTGA